jgi:hypothetical protein
MNKAAISSFNDLLKREDIISNNIEAVFGQKPQIRILKEYFDHDSFVRILKLEVLTSQFRYATLGVAVVRIYDSAQIDNSTYNIVEKLINQNKCNYKTLELIDGDNYQELLGLMTTPIMGRSIAINCGNDLVGEMLEFVSVETNPQDSSSILDYLGVAHFQNSKRRIEDLLNHFQGAFKCPTEEALQEIFQEFPLSVFQTIKDEVLKIDHFAFMVSHEINEEELHRILLENGFGDNYRHFPSTIISKELGRVENKEQVPTEIYKATLTNGDRDIEIFIPNASNQQIHHWIESGLGSHIAFKVKSEESIMNILKCLYENRIPIPDFMMGKPLRNEIEGTVVLYCNVISKGLHFRVEFCHKRS